MNIINSHIDPIFGLILVGFIALVAIFIYLFVRDRPDKSLPSPDDIPAAKPSIEAKPWVAPERIDRADLCPTMPQEDGMKRLFYDLSKKDQEELATMLRAKANEERLSYDEVGRLAKTTGPTVGYLLNSTRDWRNSNIMTVNGVLLVFGYRLVIVPKKMDKWSNSNL